MKVLVERAGALGRVPLRADETFVIVTREDLGALHHVDGVVAPTELLPRA